MLKEKTLFRGELALPFAVLINSFGVVLMAVFRRRNIRDLKCPICVF